MKCVGLVTCPTNDEKWNENATKAVDCKNNQGENGIASWHVKASNRNHCCSSGDVQGDFLGGLVIFSPFWFDVVGNGGGTSKDLTVSS